MTEAQITTYREKIDQQIHQKVGEIESNISLIIIGSLGFFLTINEKFIGLKDAQLSLVMLISVALLLASFAFFLYSKHATVKYDRDILDFLDNKMVKDTPSLDSDFLTKWEGYDKKLTNKRATTYWLLGLGILAQVIFFLYNIYFNESKKESDQQKLKIEVITKDSSTAKISTTIFIDTSDKKTITHATKKESKETSR